MLKRAQHDVAGGLAVLLLLFLPTPALADRAESIEHVRKAEAALARGRPRDARVELLNAIKEDVSYAPAHLLQAKVYLKLGDGIAAEAELSRARAAGMPRARMRHLIGHALLLQDAPDRALAEVDPAITPPVFAAYAARVRGRALTALGDNDGAARAFGLAMRLAPRDSDLWVDVGRFRLATGESAGAVEAADRAVALGPRNPDALLLKGELARTQYGLVAAMPWFERALKIDPHNVPVLLAKASTLGDLGRMRAMLATTRLVLTIDDRNPTAFYLQAVLAARAGKFRLARALMQRTNGAIDDKPATMLLVGAIEYQLGNVEQAIERLARLISLQPDNIKARRILGAAQWRAGDVRATIETLQPVVDLPDADSYVLTLIGRAYERMGRRELAANYLDRAAMPAPELAARPVDPQEIAVLQRGVAAAPNAAEPRIALIRALLRSNRNDEALAQALVLQRSNPGAPAAHVIAGDALSAVGRFADAAESYKRAANISFTEPIAVRLVEALSSAGQAKAASEALSLYLGQNPQSVAAQLLAVDFMMSAGQYKRAAAVLEGLRKRLGDRDAALLNNLAWAYFQAGRKAEALPLAQKAYALTPANAAVSDTYGWILYQTGKNPVRAISLLEQAVAQAPRNPGVRWHLAQAYAAEGRKAEARKATEAALKLPGFADAPRAKALLARP